jgi:hypothetical protein
MLSEKNRQVLDQLNNHEVLEEDRILGYSVKVFAV